MIWLQYWPHVSIASVSAAFAWVYRAELFLTKMEKQIMTINLATIESDIASAANTLPAIASGISEFAPFLSMIPALKPYATAATAFAAGAQAIAADLPAAIQASEAAATAIEKLVADFEAAAGITKPAA
jgi:hypothetical protein